MKTPLPHFGTVIAIICDCVALDEAHECKNPTAAISERTVRTIKSGKPVTDKSWDEYADELIAALTALPLFPLLAKDTTRLRETFHSFRQSYELLNTVLSGENTTEEVIHRAALRLTILDFGLRHAALCFAEGTIPTNESPLWLRPDGVNDFWRTAMEQKFPGTTLVGSSDAEGDCAKRLKMDPSKFKRCLYENDFPGLPALRRLFPNEKDLVKAARHYAAYRLCRRLADAFGQLELEAWVYNALVISCWLHKFIVHFAPTLPDNKREIFLTNIFMGGASGKMLGKALREKLGAEIHVLLRDDILAMATNDPMSSIRHYIAFCNEIRDNPPPEWEMPFVTFRADCEHFTRTGTFRDGRKPSSRAVFACLLERARKTKDQKQEEKILRAIIDFYPDDCEARQLLGQLCEATGRKEEAWHWYEQAYQTNRSFVLPLFSLADSKSRAGLHPEAIAIATGIQEPGVGPGSRAYLISVCQIRDGKLSEAIPLLESAFQSGWKPGQSAALLALCHERFLPSRPDAAKDVRKWKKLALHHGFKIEDTSSLLD